MAAANRRIPKYRHHTPSGLAVVTIDGRHEYLGKYGTPESRAAYDRRIAEWLGNDRVLPAPGAAILVLELLAAYARWADGYYRKGGAPTGTARNIKLAVRKLAELYGPTPARDFGPVALKAVRDAMVADGLRRVVVNQRARHVVRAFAWGVEHELVPAAVHHALAAVRPLQRGRSAAVESTPVRPVEDERVDAILPHVPARVRAMIELQRLTGMRPGEACALRAGDVDRSGDVWVYRPGSHKTEHHGRTREVYLGPKAREILRPWLRDDPAAYLFSPAESVAERRASPRGLRPRPVPPTPPGRAAARKAGDRYSVRSYGRAIERGCRHAGVARWHPNQLRHLAATRFRREHGLEAARILLGHADAAMTEVYAERDARAAIDVIRLSG